MTKKDNWLESAQKEMQKRHAGRQRRAHSWTGFGCRHTRGPEPCPRNTNGDCRVNAKLSHFERSYGIDRGEILAALERQNKCCALCRKPFQVFIATGAGRKAGWVPDHCHKTGKLRAILCHGCNVKIGLFGDDPELLERAAAYLRRCGVSTEPDLK